MDTPAEYASLTQSVVVECAYDRNAGSWGIQHTRPDKNQANYITTVLSTMETIIDGITMQDLISILN